jgi:ribulose-5-phosphate 4-epimerase/fuculose-1-phosphate aldolase
MARIAMTRLPISQSRNFAIPQFRNSERTSFMSAPEKATKSNVRDLVSTEEWQARVDLAAAYRLVADYGWDDLVFTHISARVPGPEHHFLINPYGMMFEEITASSLVKVDLDGNIVMDSDYSINPAGFTIHSAVHAAREDALCVMHLHTDNGIAVSAQENGLLPISQQALFVLASLGYHDYEGLALNDEERPRLVGDLGNKTFLILRNHGLLTVGQSVPDAFLSMFLLERACRIQILAQSGGSRLIPISDQILAQIPAQEAVVTQGGRGRLAWPGLLRKLDRLGSNYRD